MLLPIYNPYRVWAMLRKKLGRVSDQGFEIFIGSGFVIKSRFQLLGNCAHP